MCQHVPAYLCQRCQPSAARPLGRSGAGEPRSCPVPLSCPEGENVNLIFSSLPGFTAGPGTFLGGTCCRMSINSLN